MNTASEILDGMETIVESILNSNTALTYVQGQQQAGLSHSTLMANMISQQNQQAGLNSAVAMYSVRNLTRSSVDAAAAYQKVLQSEKIADIAGDLKAQSRNSSAFKW